MAEETQVHGGAIGPREQTGEESDRLSRTPEGSTDRVLDHGSLAVRPERGFVHFDGGRLRRKSAKLPISAIKESRYQSCLERSR
jgi:hypothetical protein